MLHPRYHQAIGSYILSFVRSVFRSMIAENQTEQNVLGESLIQRKCQLLKDLNTLC